jgi:hypothetical protein
MNELDKLKPMFGDKKTLFFVGIGTFCAGILIGFKLAGGQKVELIENPPVQLVTELTSETQETEAEND